VSEGQNENQKIFIFSSEPQPNFAKQSSARWVKNKMKKL